MDPRSRIRELRGLYLVLTSPRIPHVELAAAAVERRVPVIQLREKDLDDAALTELARSLSEITAGSDTLFIVNDRPDIAALVSAGGVHVGTSDVDPAAARTLVGPSAIVGVSANTPTEILRARDAGADYIGVGPIFATGTKPDASRPIGLSGLADAGETLAGLPTVAIGGITAKNARSVLATGAEFVAVVSDVCFAPDPVRALDRFLAAIQPGAA
jgi:thiamine-phosphate pyrophosphorylase